MKTILEPVKDFLKNKGVSFTQLDNEPVLKASFRGDNGNFIILVIADDKNRLLEAFIICPLNIPKSRLTPTTELIVRINHRIRLGNFDIDLMDGEIGFRASVNAGNIAPSRDTLSKLIFGSFFLMDHFFPAIASVVFGNSAPEKAIAALHNVIDQKNK